MEEGKIKINLLPAYKYFLKTAADPDEEDWGQHLATWRPRLETWARELAVGQWPQAPDHVDFHSENALVDDTDTITWEKTDKAEALKAAL